MKKKQITYIVADNIITALGFTTAENIQKIEQEQTGVQKHQNPTLFPRPFWAALINDEQLNVEVKTKIEQPEKYTRLEQLIILSIQDILAQTQLDLTQKDTLIILASTKGNIDLLEHKNRGEWPKERVQLGALAKVIQEYFENPNTPLVVCNACVSGVLALEVAERLLQQGKYKNILVVGGDIISEFTLSGFDCFKAMSNAPCKPYDTNRTGINLGEGVATMLLSTQKPKQQEYITLDGVGSSNDANHISGPSRTGDGLYLAIIRALKAAGSEAEELDYLSMHGTATPYNDEMESKALALADLSKVPLNSYKGYFGHTLGAAGLIESIIATQSLKKNMLFRSLGFKELGVPQPINVIQTTTSKVLTKSLKTASGFGGCNAAAIFTKHKLV
ncbi:MAG: hypothetical protein MK212_21340 [Saprospiraceae bacterium]|nr:hypothetical protein [Saprospiraceae bacterium]